MTTSAMSRALRTPTASSAIDRSRLPPARGDAPRQPLTDSRIRDGSGMGRDGRDERRADPALIGVREGWRSGGDVVLAVTRHEVPRVRRVRVAAGPAADIVDVAVEGQDRVVAPLAA